jgi:hypothetical protein
MIICWNYIKLYKFIKRLLDFLNRKPACFWITSPLTKMRNNVAAGGAVSQVFIWAMWRQSQRNAFATSMDPDQPVHPRSLVRIHAVRLPTLLQVGKLIANSMDPDQTARMRRLVWIHAGHKRTWFCRDTAHIISYSFQNDQLNN